MSIEGTPRETLREESPVWAERDIRSAADLSLTTMLSALDWAASFNDTARCGALITAIYRELDKRP